MIELHYQGDDSRLKPALGVLLEKRADGVWAIDPYSIRQLAAFLSRFEAVRFVVTAHGEQDRIEVIDNAIRPY